MYLHFICSDDAQHLEGDYFTNNLTVITTTTTIRNFSKCTHSNVGVLNPPSELRDCNISCILYVHMFHLYIEYMFTFKVKFSIPGSRTRLQNTLNIGPHLQVKQTIHQYRLMLISVFNCANILYTAAFDIS